MSELTCGDTSDGWVSWFSIGSWDRVITDVGLLMKKAKSYRFNFFNDSKIFGMYLNNGGTMSIRKVDCREE